MSTDRICKSQEMAGNEYDPAAEINFDTLHLESLSYIAYDII